MNGKLTIIFCLCCLLVGMTIGNMIADSKLQKKQTEHNTKVEAELKYLHGVAEKF